MTAPSTSIWTARPELEATAKTLWPNHSASQIAAKLSAEFNILISRNAVIGRLSRTGYNIAQKTEVHFNVRSDRTTRIPVTRAPRAPRPSKPRQRPVVCEALPSRQLSLDQLGPEECRFIAGDPRERRRNVSDRAFQFMGSYRQLRITALQAERDRSVLKRCNRMTPTPTPRDIDENLATLRPRSPRAYSSHAISSTRPHQSLTLFHLLSAFNQIAMVVVALEIVSGAPQGVLVR